MLPPRKMIRAEAGLGKTRAIIKRLAAGNERATVLVPRHRLADELVEHFRAAGLEPAVWRGLEADDPEQPGAKMCTNLELSSAALAVGLLDDACGICPMCNTCGHRRQRHQQSRVWIAANNFMFTSPPSPLRSADLLIVDESFWQHSLVGNDKPRLLALSTLSGDVAPLRGIDGDRLHHLRGRLIDAFQASGAGPLKRSALIAARLDAAGAGEARALAWRRKPDGKLLKGRDSKTAVALLTAARQNFTPREPLLWGRLKRFLEGDSRDVAPGIVLIHDADLGAVGSGDAVALAWREELAEAWAELPVLLLDATTEPAINRLFLPDLEVTELAVKKPHVHVTQLVEPLPTGRLAPRRADDGRNGNRAANTKRIADRLTVDAAGAGEVLAVATIAVEAEIKGHVPQNVTLRHYGDIEGEDIYRDVDAVTLAGWPLPPLPAIERQAELLFDRPIACVGGGHWPMAPGGLRLVDGTGYGVERPCHPDPGVEALRWTLTEGRMIQAIERARGVNRRADRPLKVLVLSPIPLPGYSVERTIRWPEVEPSRFHRALVQLGGILPLAPAALAATGLWPTVEAARKDLMRERGELGDNALIQLLLGRCPLIAAAYRLPGPGRPSRCLFAATLSLAEARGRLEALLGPLAYFALDGAPSPKQAEVAAELGVDVPAEGGELPAAVPPEPRGVEPAELPASAAHNGIPAATAGPVPPAASAAIAGPPAPPLAYGHGIVPEPLRAWSRARRRAAGISQEAVARRIGLSRPQLANAEAGRFGLSPDAAARFLSTVAGLEFRQGTML